MELNEEEVIRNTEKCDQDARRMIRAAKFNTDKEAALRNKIKICNEEALVLELEKGNNLRIFCSKTAFEWVKRFLKTQLANAEEHIINKDREGGIYSESITDKVKWRNMYS